MIDAARKAGACDNAKGMRRDVLKGFALETLKDHLIHPDLVKKFITAFHDELNAESHSRAQLEQQTRKELADVDRRLDGLIAAIAQGFRSVDLQNKLDGLSAQKRKLESKQGLESCPPITEPHNS